MWIMILLTMAANGQVIGQYQEKTYPTQAACEHDKAAVMIGAKEICRRVRPQNG